MKKKFFLYAAAAAAGVFFVSCGGLNLPKGSFAEIKEIPPSYMDKSFLMPDAVSLMYWEDGRFYKNDILSRSSEWESAGEFELKNFHIKMKGEDGETRLDAKRMTHISYSDDKKLMGFTMKLGTSVNSTIGIADTAAREIIFSEPVKKREKSQMSMSGIILEKIFFKPVFSENGKYACYGYIGQEEKRNVRVRKLDGNRGYFDIKEAARYAVFNGRVFVIQKGAEDSVHEVNYYELEGGKNKSGKIAGFNEPIHTIISSGRSVFVMSNDNIYRLNAEGGADKIYDMEPLKQGFDKFGIYYVFAAAVEEKEYIFLYARTQKEEKYRWIMYGGDFSG
ncbi:MAG: hypothetical protein ACLFP1_04965 [Candidatus Goldiibacteriota bacterium]